MTKQYRGAISRQPDYPRRSVSVELGSTTHQFDKALRILRVKQLIERTCLSRATLYVLMSRDPTFPRKIKLTARTIGFLETEVDAWIKTRAQSRDAM